MNFPIVEQIAQTFVSRLEQVTVANGYQQDISSVVRPTKLGGYTPQHLMAVLVQADPKRSAYTMESEAIVWDQPFDVILFVSPSTKTNTPIEQAINVFRSDIERAICTDTSGNAVWWQFADAGPALAIGAHINDPKSIPSSDGSIEGIVVEIVVTYATLLRDPYSTP